MDISPKQQAALVEALTKGFTSASLQRVLEVMNVPLGILTDSRAYSSSVLEVVRWALSHDRLAELVETALQANTRSPELRRLNAQLAATPQAQKSIEELAQTVGNNSKDWTRRMLEISQQVCRLDSDDHVGTGVLIGPSQVMTHLNSLHTSANELGGLLQRASITATFAGDAPYKVRKQPVFLFSNGVLILELGQAAGRSAASSKNFSQRTRGWMAPPRPSADDEQVLVVVTSSSVNPLVGQGTRVRDGEFEFPDSVVLPPGSVGSPCFDSSLNLFGIYIGETAERGPHGVTLSRVLPELQDMHLSWTPSAGIVDFKSPTRSLAQPPSKNNALDEVVRSFVPSQSEHDPDDDVWSSIGDQDPSDPDRWAWAEAAAVVSRYDPERLRPSGSPPDTARVAVLLESTPAQTPAPRAKEKSASTKTAHRQAPNINAVWTLSERVRRRALHRLGKRGELKQTRVRQVAVDNDPIDWALSTLITESDPAPADLQSPERLRALLQAARWLANTGTKLPATDNLRATLEHATLLAPFRHLTKGFFAGRDAELKDLAGYVNEPDDSASFPILIHGPGGMGKSALLAHFILTHAERGTRPEEWRAFAYLDFDRPELDARDLVGVMMAIARQLGQQVPSVQSHIDAMNETRRLQQERIRASVDPVQRANALTQRAMPAELQSSEAELVKIIRAVYIAVPAPLLLVLDTLEEVQYATPDAVEPLVQLAIRLRKAAPSLRPVLAGRIEADSKQLRQIKLQPLPHPAAEALLANHLPAALAARTEWVARMVDVVGGNPLSLRLAAEVLTQEHADSSTSLGEQEWQRVGDAIVQGQLYRRIVGHLHDENLKNLAIPGLVLRFVTWELIRDVLAGACDIDIPNDETARAIFDDLSREVALVRQGGSTDKLVLRPELRRTVVENFRKDARSAPKRIRIHQLAIEYFSKRTTVEDRAEEVYHRLWLGEDAASIDARWINGAEQLLRSAVEELDGPARLYLSNRVGGLSEDSARGAPLEEWEPYAERRATDLLTMSRVRDALDLLQTRPERLPTSRLHLIESIALRSLPTPELSNAEVAAQLAVAAARASNDQEQLQRSLQELVQVLRLRQDTPGVLRALAELGELGEELGDDLILLHSQVSGLESIDTSETLHQISEPAVRVFSRLPDELIASAPELARRVAAQTGAVDPEVIKRVARVVGLGPLNQRDTAGLESVLADWATRDNDVKLFLPKADASAQEVSNTAQYLLTTRHIDTDTATQVADWLKGAVASVQYETAVTNANDSASEHAPDQALGYTNSFRVDP